jgi:hypothetical protein
MNTLYRLSEKIKTELQSNTLINTVSYGDIEDIDLNKQTIFPLAHVNLTNAVIRSSSVEVNVSILLMDIVDISKSEDVDYFGNDNEHDVLNSMLTAATKTVQELHRGNSYAEGFHLEDDANCEFFTDRFENKLAGVSLTFSVNIQNSATLC